MLEFVIIFAVFSGVTNGSPMESPNSRIHGGVDAPESYAPHMVALLNGDRRVFVTCGGSLVSRRHVLTAAHCVTPFVEDNGKLIKTFHGRAGSNIWHSGGQLVQFNKHFIHPGWDEVTIKNDVAVLCLTEQLKFSDTVNKIGLEFDWVEGGQRSYVTGWGKTWPVFDENSVNLSPTPDRLQLLHMNTMDFEECVKSIASKQEWYEIAPHLDSAVEICTFHSVGRGMCQGDSGSALVSAKSGLQSGIVSWGLPCAQGAPDIYTRVSGVADFLTPILTSC